jgi:hypothetical protein
VVVSCRLDFSAQAVQDLGVPAHLVPIHRPFVSVSRGDEIFVVHNSSTK